MGILSKLARRAIPSAQGVADTFLSGVGGGAAGAVAGGMMGQDDDIVPGMLAGAGAGIGAHGARGLMMALAKKFPHLSPEEIMQMISRMGGR